MQKKLPLIISVLVALGLVGGALYIRKNRHTNYASSQSIKKVFNASELSKNDGKDGRDCLVAVDGTVYKIQQGTLWKDGQHVTSEGQASCGRDLSEVITKSPHGKSKLSTLEVVGTFNNH